MKNVRQLIDDLQRATPEVQASVARALARSGASGVVALSSMLTSSVFHDRAVGARALAAIGSTAAATILIRELIAIRDKRPCTRMRLMEAIASIDKEIVVTALDEELEPQDVIALLFMMIRLDRLDDLQQYGAELAKNLGHPEVLPVLRAQLRIVDPKSDLATSFRQAIEALERVGVTERLPRVSADPGVDTSTLPRHPGLTPDTTTLPTSQGERP